MQLIEAASAPPYLSKSYRESSTSEAVESTATKSTNFGPELNFAGIEDLGLSFENEPLELLRTPTSSNVPNYIPSCEAEVPSMVNSARKDVDHVWWRELVPCANDIIELLKDDPEQGTYTQTPDLAGTLSSPTSILPSMLSTSTHTAVSQVGTSPLFHQYQNDRWMSHFSKLMKYKDVHGNCDVPYQFEEDSSLAQWVKRQRRQFQLFTADGKRSSLTAERVRMLNSLGFTWNTRDIAWEMKFMKLKTFHGEYHHCKVPADYLNGTLANWLKKQRRQYRRQMETGRSTLTRSRIEKMESLGFVWGKHNGPGGSSLSRRQ